MNVDTYRRFTRIIFALISISLAAASMASPPAPTALWVTPQNTWNQLSWNVVPGSPQFRIYRGLASGKESPVPIAVVSGTNYNDSSLTNGKTYYYIVRTLFGNELSPASAEASGTPGTPLLNAPTLAAAPGVSSIKLYWTPDPMASFYLIERYDPVLGWQVIAKTQSQPTTYLDKGVVNGFEYSYQVFSGNKNGVGNLSAAFQATAGDAATSAPGGIWASPQNNAVALGWTPVPAAQGYVLYRSSVAGSEGYVPYAVLNSTTAGFTDGASNGSTFYYKVAAFDSSGVGYQTGECSATAGGTYLPAPSVALTNATGTIQVDWTQVSGATGYFLFRSVADQYHYQLVTKLPTYTFSYLDNSVTAGIQYYYLVAGVDSDGVGRSGAASTKADTVGPSAPTGLVATGGNITLSWNAVSGVRYYNVYRGTSPGSETLYAPNVHGTSVGDYGVDLFTLYFYKVKSVVGSVESPFSLEVSAATTSTTLSAPLLAASVAKGQTTLSFNTVPGALTYNVYRAIDQDTSGYRLIAQFLRPVAENSFVNFTDSTALSNITYDYIVAGVNLYGEGQHSGAVTATSGNSPLPSPTGTIAFSNSNSVTVSCDPVPGAVSYNIYRSLTPTMPPDPIAVGQKNSFADWTAVVGTLYYYAFAAVDNDGQSLLSPVCSGQVGTAASPSPLLTLNQTSTTNILNWSPSTAATGYDIYRTSDPKASGYTMIAQNFAGLKYADSAVSRGTEYYYLIYPVTINGAGNISNRVSGVPGSTPIFAPTGLAADAGSSSISIYFNPVPGALTYNLYRATTSGGEGTVPMTIGSNNPNFGDGGLVPGTTYFYTVTAVNDHGQSVQSEEVSARVGSTQLAAPSFSVVATPTSIRVAWSSVSGATSYNVYRQITGGASYLVKHVTGLTYLDSGIIPGATYSYTVTAVNSDGEGVAGPQQSAHT